jgi:DNA-binding response OmpR family regulator
VYRGYRIAVIESDDLIRQLALRWLGEAGHEVCAITTAQLQRDAAFALIVANAANPRSAGPLMRSIAAAHSGPVLLVSARFRRSQDPSASLALQLGVSAVLAKPFTRDELLSAVAAALAQAPPAAT